ncbi:hypothetical protein FRC12_019339 [Ceratobasidium sp. 428]|nr:hypothetical protein FRC12_019339 [Ceratobasidium sp. 428]
MKKRMTADQQAQLEQLQRDIAGDDSVRPAEQLFDPTLLKGLLNPPDEPQDAWEDVEDEAAVQEGIGIAPANPEWTNRLANEHSVWTAQISELCDAYLASRSGINDSAPTESSTASFEILCVDIDGEYFLFLPTHKLISYRDLGQVTPQERFVR